MTNIDKQLADNIVKENRLSITKLGLRFDKVVVRLLENLRTFVEQDIQNKGTILMTLTAPIKIPSKTEQEIKRHIKNLFDSGVQHRDKELTVFKNEVRFRLVDPSTKNTTKFIGFVHNPGSDPKLLLDLASQWLKAT
jgi:hypothetical protein